MSEQKITTFLWFATEAEAAATFYASVFGGRVLSVQRMGDAVMSVQFELHGQRYTALNGNPKPSFTEAISLMVACADQPEVDALWEKLLAGGGAPLQCGWLKDRFGVTWQVVPNGLMNRLADKDPAVAARVMKAFRAMTKIDLAALDRARAGTT